jgi:hypothetical protein
MVDKLAFVGIAFLCKTLYAVSSSLAHLMHHLHTAQFGASHRSTHRLIPSIYLRHSGLGGRKLHICKL